MEFAVEFGGEPQDVTVTASGVADVAGLRELVRTLAADERYRAGLLLLYDFSDLDMSQLSDDELEQVTETVMERDWRSQPRAVATSPGRRRSRWSAWGSRISAARGRGVSSSPPATTPSRGSQQCGRELPARSRGAGGDLGTR